MAHVDQADKTAFESWFKKDFNSFFHDVSGEKLKKAQAAFLHGGEWDATAKVMPPPSSSPEDYAFHLLQSEQRKPVPSTLRLSSSQFGIFSPKTTPSAPDAKSAQEESLERAMNRKPNKP